MKKILPFVLLFLLAVSAFSQERPDQKKTPKSKSQSTISSHTAGDLIIKSSKLRLSALTISIGTSTLYATGVFNEMTPEDRQTILILSGAASLSLYIAGELTLIKAGKLLNQEKITLSPASEGIGLAINF